MPFEKGNPYRFEKGHERQGGRPEGSVSINTELRRKLKEKVAGDKEGRTYLDALVTKIMAEVMKDNDRVLIEFWQQMEGRAKQQVDMNLEGGTDNTMHIILEGVDISKFPKQ